MDWLGEIAGGVASAASGGLFGFVGSIVSAGFKLWEKREERAFQKDQWAHEENMHQLQMQARAAETEQELAIVSQEGSWSGLEATVAADAATAEETPGWVNAVRSLFRPILTTGLVAIMVWMFFALLDAIQGANDNLLMILSETDVRALLRYIVYSTVFAAMAAVTWWFGERAMTPPGLKAR